jgi:hypothetical protein
LRDELKHDLTVLLLSCGVALKEADLSDSVRLRLQRIEELAKHIREKLGISHEESGAAAGA